MRARARSSASSRGRLRHPVASSPPRASRRLSTASTGWPRPSAVVELPRGWWNRCTTGSSATPPT
eukprot:4443722-Lingulodinium_polyedra.AAC.1